MRAANTVQCSLLRYIAGDAARHLPSIPESLSAPMSVASTAPASDAPARRGTRDIVVPVSILLATVSLWASWVRFPQVWSEFREHGFAVAGVSVWLLWRERELLREPGQPMPWLALPLAGLSVLWLLAVVSSAQVVHLLLAPAMMFGWLWAVRGTSVARTVAPIAAMFLLAVPVWEVLFPLLQQATVTVNHLLIWATGLNADVTGTHITLPYGTLVVAQSCAGMNYFMSGLTLGTSYALSLSNDKRVQVKLILLAAGLALVSNWIRVFGLVLVANATQMKSSLMESHGTYGWVIFAGTLPLFAYFAQRIERQASVAASERDIDAAQADTPEVSPSALAVTRRSALFAALAIMLGPALLATLYITRNPAPSPIVWFGLQPAATWTEVSPGNTAWTPSFLGFSSQATRAWVRTADTVLVNRFVFGTSARGSELFAVNNRLAADSITISDRVIGPLDANLRTVRESVIQVDGRIRLAWWWYRVGGVETPVRSKAKFLEAWGLLTNASQPEVLVVSANCGGNDCTSARSALHELVTGRPMPAPNGSGSNQ